MAFKPRNINNGIEKVERVDSTENISKNTQKQLVQKKKTYREEAIEILNHLDSKGINIYDENRTPGMYLKGKNSNSKIVNFLGNKNSVSQSNQLDNKNQNNTPKNILSFLANKK